MIHNLKYQGSATYCCKVTRMRKSEFVAKTQFLSLLFLLLVPLYIDINKRINLYIKDNTRNVLLNNLKKTWLLASLLLSSTIHLKFNSLILKYWRISFRSIAGIRRRRGHFVHLNHFEDWVNPKRGDVFYFP